jgi:ankyrin repeat protein
MLDETALDTYDDLGHVYDEVDDIACYLFRDVKGKQLFDAIEEHRIEEALSLTASRCTDLDYHDSHGRTPLHSACYMGASEVFEALMEHHARVQVYDNYKQTPLHWAAWFNHADMATVLIEKGIDVDTQTLNGETALTYAAKQGHLEIVQLLVEAGADFSIMTSDDQTAIDVAGENGWTEIVQFLQQ